MRVYDCFMFFSELDLLEIRLASLNHVVDRFVLVESRVTHTGKPKRLWFEEHKYQHRFNQYLHKIEHIIVDKLDDDDPWVNEATQRNAIGEGLYDLEPNDIVLVSDVDELPNPDIFPLNINGPHKLRQKFYYYYVNLQLNHDGSTSMVCLGRDFKQIGGAEALRRMEHDVPIIENAGWHYSYLGTPEDLVEKIEALAHTENDKEEYKDLEYIRNCIDNEQDLFGRDLGLRLVRVEGPPYLRLNFARFGRFIKTTTVNRASLRLLEGKKDLVGVEIGVMYGSNALNILNHLDIKKLYLVDPYCSYIGWDYSNAKKWSPLRENIAKEALAKYDDKIVWLKEFSADAANMIEDNLDFVYVDGNHAYDFVKEDIRLYYPKLKIGGVLGGHDYQDTPVKRAVDEMFGWRLNTALNIDEPPTDWWVFRTEEERIIEQVSVLEQDVVMGVFTHRTTYLPTLLDSIRKFLPHIQMIVKVADGGINVNMERLRQDFLRTDKRFWVFLDDDIQFLDGEIIYTAVSHLLANKFGAIGVYSTFDPDYVLEPTDAYECQEVGWIPGYFIMVDSHRVGHLTPDLDLPHENTAVDTSYSMAIRIAGYKLGIAPSVVYHQYKKTPLHELAYAATNEYLLDKYGSYYFDHIGAFANIVGKMPSE